MRITIEQGSPSQGFNLDVTHVRRGKNVIDVMTSQLHTDVRRGYETMGFPEGPQRGRLMRYARAEAENNFGVIETRRASRVDTAHDIHQAGVEDAVAVFESLYPQSTPR